MLSALVFSPLLALLVFLALPKRLAPVGRWLNVLIALLQLVLLAIVWRAGAAQGYGPGYWLEAQYPWLSLPVNGGTLTATLHWGVDGLSFLLLLLTPLIMLLATLASWPLKQSPKAYYALLLLLNGALMGTFLAQDLLLFYLFFELMLLPMYFLIGMWGGERRRYAAIKFFLYTLVGSMLLLVVMIGLAFGTGASTPEGIAYIFDIPALQNPALRLEGTFFSTASGQLWGFGLLFAALAIKLPIVPLHTWLPDAHVEASTPISVILAGVLLKVGGYGLLRLCYGIFPEAGLAASWWVGLIAVVSILYGALLALAQTDLKRLVAYSSVAHMGYVTLGLASGTAVGTSGAVLQLFNHGLVSAMLFLLVGVLYDRTHNRNIGAYQGLWGHMPTYATFVLIAFFAGLGLPGTNTFISELLVFTGAFSSAAAGSLPTWMAAAGVVGIFLSAAYFLWALQRMFFGELKLQEATWREALTPLSRREWLLLLPLVVLIILFGIWPSLLTRTLAPWAANFAATLAASPTP